MLSNLIHILNIASETCFWFEGICPTMWNKFRTKEKYQKNRAPFPCLPSKAFLAISRFSFRNYVWNAQYQVYLVLNFLYNSETTGPNLQSWEKNEWISKLQVWKMLLWIYFLFIISSFIIQSRKLTSSDEKSVNMASEYSL